MTTKVKITNENHGAPFADWSVAVSGDGVSLVLAPGESEEVYLWHDGRELKIREIPKS